MPDTGRRRLELLCSLRQRQPPGWAQALLVRLPWR